MIKKIIQFTLGIVTVPIISIIVSMIFKISKFDFSNNLLTIGALISFIFVFLFKRHKVYFITSLIFSCLFLSLNLYSNYSINKYSKGYSINWNSKVHNTTIPFHIKDNLIFIKAKINNEEKYLLFDTGAEIPLIKNQYNNSETIGVQKIIDANGNTKIEEIKELNNLSIGGLNFEKVKNVSLNTDTTNGKNLLSKDFIAGILGCNLMNSFVWDLNLKNNTIHLTDSKFNENISQATTIPLIEYNNRWKIEIKVNGDKKKAMFDSGSNAILTLKDSIKLPKDYIYQIKKYANSNTLYSNTNYKNIERKIFVNLSISNLIFKDIPAFDNNESNVIGNPILWEYERVVLDFISKKIYLLNKNNSTKLNSISNKSQVARIKNLEK